MDKLQSFLNFQKKSKKPKSRGNQGEWLLQKSSDGKALQGIYLTKKLDDQLQVRGQLLDVPQDTTITQGSMQTNNITKEFSMAHQEDEYKKIVEVLGHSATASFSSSIPVYGDVTFGIGASKGDETNEVLFLSTLKFSTIHLTSYYFKSGDLKLSNNAKGDLGNILRMQKADSPDVQEACKQFFLKYGSHANRGPISFGADIMWKCFSKGFESSELDTVKKMQSDAISNTGEVTFTPGVCTNIMERIKEKYSTNCSKNTRANTHLIMTKKGFRPETANFSKWEEGLLADKNKWIITDRGEKLVAVWDIIKRNHRDLDDVIDVLKTTWESVTGLEAALNSPLLKVEAHSLQCALETEAEERTYPQGEPVFTKNKSAHDLFKELNLSKHYPMGLSQEEALCVKSGPLEFSLNLTNPTSFQDIPYLVLHKLMAYDHRCRSDLMPAKSLDNEDEDDYTIIRSPVDKKIHPVDILLAVFICSDNFLRQDLLSRLAKCQLAVPFILQDPFTKQLSIPLWAMHSIIKEFNNKKKVVSITNYKMPIISFIRFGKQKKHGVSKSKLLNEIISESHYDHFLTHSGQSEVLLGKGLVDMCWYLPSGKPKEAFPDAITFLNLHGDARDYPQQSRFLSKISFMCFILLAEEDLKFNLETIKILKEFALSLGNM